MSAASAFLVERYVHHRDLHSFPTRRSSDLGDLPAGAAFGLGLGDNEHSPLSVKILATKAEDRENARKSYSRGLDRKSTRLNSSHVSISYAVFCLKKKKNAANKDNS